MLTNVSNPMLDAVRGHHPIFRLAGMLPQVSPRSVYVTVCGMGGSAFLETSSTQCMAQVRVNVNRDLSHHNLVVDFLSFRAFRAIRRDGRALDSLIERGDEIVTAGGKLVDRARMHGIPLCCLRSRAYVSTTCGVGYLRWCIPQGALWIRVAG